MFCDLCADLARCGRRDEVIRAALSRAAVSRVPLQVLCETSTDVAADTVQMMAQHAATLLLLDCSHSELHSGHVQVRIKTRV